MKQLLSLILFVLFCLNVSAQSGKTKTIVFENRTSNKTDPSYRTFEFYYNETDLRGYEKYDIPFTIRYNMLNLGRWSIQFFQIEFLAKIRFYDDHFILDLSPSGYSFSEGKDCLKGCGWEKYPEGLINIWEDADIESADNMVIQFRSSLSMDSMKCITSEEKIARIAKKADHYLKLSTNSVDDWFDPYSDLFVRTDEIDWSRYPKKLAKCLKKEQYKKKQDVKYFSLKQY